MNTEQIMHLLAARDSCSYDASLALEANKALQAAVEALVQERDLLNGTLQDVRGHYERVCNEREVERACTELAVRQAATLVNQRDKLAAENKVLRDALALAKDLTTIVRMPNVEYIADAHNKAVEKIQAALTRKQS
jgi:hypothetical protein